ncbi:MAG: nickel-dependent lactate racemase [Synergistaceae bacterium]|jgi:nickel-dependent lactate racemase|nr:nickel-dependent lactate racemase [Synergistaceae bacterium]
MNVSLKYGRGEVTLDIPDENVKGVLEPAASLPPIDDLGAAVKGVLSNPTAGPSLEAIVKERGGAEKLRSVVIIVNDMTRSTPSDLVLPAMLEELKRLGVRQEAITIVVATGTHRPMTDAETSKTVGEAVFKSYRVENHNCDSPDLVDMGTLSTGNRMIVNRTVAEADLRLSVGEVLLHYYAGFAGGRKSVFPGVSARDTIMRNHAQMTMPGVGIGLLEGNRLYAETDEAVEKFCPLHFIVNLVCDTHKRVVRVVGGHFRDAWLEGVKTFREMNFVKIDAPADAVIASAGGFPKDINMYQAHKGIYMASRAVRHDGAMVFLAALEEGFGHKVFAEWAERGWTPSKVREEFEKKFTFGAHKLYYLADHALNFKMYLVSEMNQEQSRLMFCEKIAPGAVLQTLKAKLGNAFQVYIIPQGGIVLPTLPTLEGSC